MADGQVTVDAAIADAESLQRALKRQRAKQVQSDDEKRIVKGIVLAWFNKHRPILVSCLGEDEAKGVDEIYRGLLEASGRATTRTKYLDALKAVKKLLGILRTQHVIALAAPAAGAKVMRDYRNYIHPQKELSHGVTIVEGDAQMLWEIAKGVIRQIL